MIQPSKRTKRNRVVVCGQKQVAERCLDFLFEQPDAEICAIVSSPQDWQADLISWGTARQIKVLAGNINDYLDELTELEPDFLFSLQYGPLLLSPILKLPSRGCINLHFGLLPRYGGCYPIAWAILNGEKQAGVTLHYMTEAFDEGDIIAQTSVPIGVETTARELYDSATRAAVDLFATTYPAICDGTISTRKQDLSEKLYYPQNSIDFQRDRVVDWHLTAPEIQRRICAFTFEPFQLPVTSLLLPDGRVLQVTVAGVRRAKAPAGGTRRSAGRVLEVTESGGIVVATGSADPMEIKLLDGQRALDFIESLGIAPMAISFQ